MVRVVLTADCLGHLQSDETRLVNPRTMVMSTIKPQYSIFINGENGGKNKPSNKDFNIPSMFCKQM